VFTRLIVRARLCRARKHRQYILGQIADWTFRNEDLHPESLERVLVERTVEEFLIPELDQTERQIRQLEARLKRA